MSERDGAAETVQSVDEMNIADGSPEEMSTVESNTDVPIVADPVLLNSRDIARAALGEITDPHTIGIDAGHDVHDAMTVTVYFESKLPGYPGWRWAAALAKVADDAPVTVLEVELLPGEGAVLAPEWVPWSERLAQYREGQSRQAADEALEAEEAADELADMDDVEGDDLMENDYSDFDDELDGVDIDSYDDDSDDDSDEDSDDDSDDEDGDSEDE